MLEVHAFRTPPCPPPLRKRILPAAFWVLLVAAASLVAGESRSADRDVELRFLPPPGPVTGYRAYLIDETMGVEHVMKLGFVAADPDGIARTFIVLDEATSYTVGMTAFNSAGESDLSNQIAIAAVMCNASVCEDGNVCTIDSCDASGCLQTLVADGTACDDGLVETVDDQCVGGVCAGIVLACTDDFDCDDGDVCNGSEICDAGRDCLAGSPPDCGEPTQCAVPICDPLSGCLAVPRHDGTACDDGLGATIGDACLGGVCVGQPSSSELAVTAIDPDAVWAGGMRMEIRGGGFQPGAILHFEGAAGEPPNVRKLTIVSSDHLRARIYVYRNRSVQPLFFDVVVTLPDGRRARLPGALRVNPGKRRRR